MANSNIQPAISLAGLIRAQNLARKIKLRAVCLVADKRKRENVGVVTLDHKDEPVVRPRRFFHRTDITDDKAPDHAASYRLEPRRKFYEPDVRLIIQNVFEANLNGKTYDSGYCKTTAKYLSDLIKKEVKCLGYDRYKIISLVFLGQSIDQGLKISSLCLFDQDFDNFAEFRYNQGSIFAVGVVYGVYME
eukprot:gene13968-15425_t